MTELMYKQCVLSNDTLGAISRYLPVDVAYPSYRTTLYDCIDPAAIWEVSSIVSDKEKSFHEVAKYWAMILSEEFMALERSTNKSLKEEK